jgi:hypothetical protein
MYGPQKAGGKETMRKNIATLLTALLVVFVATSVCAQNNFLSGYDGNRIDERARVSMRNWELVMNGTGIWTGQVNFAASIIFSNGLTVNEDVDINFDAQDEEFILTTTTGVGVAGYVVEIENTIGDLTNQNTLLALNYTDDGDTDGRYLVCKDNAQANTQLVILANGAIQMQGALDLQGGELIFRNDETIDNDRNGELLVNGDFGPDGDALWDIGTPTNEWMHGFFDGILTVDDVICSASMTSATFVATTSMTSPDLTLSDDLIVTDDATILGTGIIGEGLTISNALAIVAGGADIQGGVLTLANDEFIDNAERDGEVLVNGDLGPDGDGLWDLGTLTNQWQDGFFDGTLQIDALEVLDVAGSTVVITNPSLGYTTVLYYASGVMTNYAYNP